MFPTIHDHIGLGHIEIRNSAGRSIDSALTNTARLEDTAVYFEFITVRGVRTPDWKFVRRFPSGPDELYFIRDDPNELNNLIGEPHYDDVRHKLNVMLEQYFSQYSNPKYDLWNGGSAKGRLLGDYGENRIFAERFPNWRPPFISKAVPFGND